MLQSSVLSRADLTLAYGKEEYEKRLKKLQKKIEKLHGEVYRRRIPVVIGFEGWDAGGKGGAIKRLTEKMDPRGQKWKRHIIICGDFGKQCQRTGILLFLTGHGMAG